MHACVLMCSCDDFVCGVRASTRCFGQVSTKTGKWQATQIEMFGFPMHRDATIVTMQKLHYGCDHKFTDVDLSGFVSS